MSTDPKKLVKMSIFAYFLAGMFLLAGMLMTFSVIPVIVFTTIAVVLYLTCCLSLWKAYQKYRINIHLFLLFIGVGLAVFSIVLAVSTQV